MDTKWSAWLELIDKLASVSATFRQTVLKLEPELRERKEVFGRWSAKDIVSHIIGWEWEVAHRFRMFLAAPVGDIPYDIDFFNNQAVTSREHLTWEQVMDELEAAQKELKRVNGEIGRENLATESRFREWTEILVNHYEHHTAQLQQPI